MKKTASLILFLICLIAAGVADVAAQRRTAVSAAEVTGTFSNGGRNANQLRIAALGRGRLRVQFSLIYAWRMDNGEWMANTGEPGGVALIEGDTATLDLSEAERACQLKITFVKPGTVEVDEVGECAGLVGGLNVSAFGTYQKKSSAKPKFERQ